MYQRSDFGEAIHCLISNTSTIRFGLSKVFLRAIFSLAASIAPVITACHRSKFNLEADWRLFRLSLS